MRRGHHTRVLAFLLLLAFCQRLGASLWVHHIYHEARVTGRHDKAGTPQWESRCDCFDDAFMPMEGTQEFTFPIPAAVNRSVSTAYLPSIPHKSLPLCCLRGPPVTSIFG